MKFGVIVAGEDWLEERSLSSPGVCHRWRPPLGFGRQARWTSASSRWTVSPERQEWVQRFNKDGKAFTPQNQTNNQSSNV